MSDQDFMKLALELAEQAYQNQEIPIGAVLVKEDQVLAKAHNRRENDPNPLHHAEILCLQQAATFLGDWRLSGCTLYVTLEPCPMCLGSLFQARIDRLVFGAFDEKRLKKDSKLLLPSIKTRLKTGKATLHSNNHNLEVQGGVMEEPCSKLLKDFFVMRRAQPSS